MSGNLSKAAQTALHEARGSNRGKTFSTCRILDTKKDKDPEEDPENSEDEESEEDKGKEFAKSVGSVVLKTALISGAVIGGTALALPLIGFGALGPIAGSLAATYQSTVLGGTIASGSIFSILQSVGMVGLSAAAKMGIISGSAAVSVATTAASKAKKKKDKENSKKKFR